NLVEQGSLAIIKGWWWIKARWLAVNTKCDDILRRFSAALAHDKQPKKYRRLVKDDYLELSHGWMGPVFAMPPTPRDVRFTPKSGHVRCKHQCPLWAKSGHRTPMSPEASKPTCAKGLVDDFVGAGQQHRRDFDPEGFRRLQVDNEFELSRLNDRKVCGLVTLEDTPGIDDD